MQKRLLFFIAFTFAVINAFGAAPFVPGRFNTITSHNDVYPYRLNNTMDNPNTARAATNTTNKKNSSASSSSTQRRVVSRPNTSRSATGSSATAMRAASMTSAPRTNYVAPTTTTMRATPRNVSVRSAVPVQTRTQTNVRTATSSGTTTSSNRVSSQHCMADYKECMDSYCQREDTAYNRCYCSAKLAQIDSKYQNKIDSLLQQILRLQYNSSVTSAEIKEYWDATVGVYTGDNPWVNIDNALNIEWADMQSRVRGQNAFNTGHEYCVQHLRACGYMATNLRDAYKSEISRDCDSYEKNLQKIQNAAESVIESYK